MFDKFALNPVARISTAGGWSISCTAADNMAFSTSALQGKQNLVEPGEPIERSHIAPNKLIDAVTRPDIAWIPSYKVYKDRVERLDALGLDRPTTVPEGWPTQIHNERVWCGSDFKSEGDFVLKLSSEDILEIEAGLGSFKGMHETCSRLRSC